MKITQTGELSDLQPTPGKTAKHSSDSTVASEGAAPVESVTINPLASQINAVSSSLSAEPTFDMSKVEAIKSAIASGNFQINPDKIANGLVESTKQLLASKLPFRN